MLSHSRRNALLHVVPKADVTEPIRRGSVVNKKHRRIRVSDGKLRAAI